MSDFFDDKNREDGENSTTEEIVLKEEENLAESKSEEEGFSTVQGEERQEDSSFEESAFEKEVLPQKEKKLGNYISTAVVLLLCAFVLFTNFVWIYCVQVSGHSMNSTLQNGDYLFVDRLAEVERGSVIVFTLENEGGTKSYIKRVVALEGDVVRMVGGELYIRKKGEENFELSQYDGVVGKTYYTKVDGGSLYEFTVSKDCAFALGDNRENSTDCRVLGEIKISSIDGVVPQFVVENKDATLGKICEITFKMREFFASCRKK